MTSTMPFVHLHLHTTYSFLDGAIKPAEAVRRAAEFGMPAIAITDHGNMFGAVTFYEEARKAGLQPVIGSEVYVSHGSMKEKKPGFDHLVLLASSEEGYRNLMYVVSRGCLEGYYRYPRVDEWKWSRARASLAATLVTFLMGVPSALSTGAQRPLGALYKAGGKDQGFLDLMDLVFGNLSLVIGALFIALFTGWAWKRAELFKEVTQIASPAVRALLWAWYVLVKVLCPLGILTILGNLIYSLVRA